MLGAMFGAMFDAVLGEVVWPARDDRRLAVEVARLLAGTEERNGGVRAYRKGPDC